MILKPRLFRKPNLSNPISKGLVGLWLMNEGSGNIVQDLSGNINTAQTWTNSPAWVSGKYGYALSFDRTTNQHIRWQGTFNGIKTIVVWAYLENSDNEQQIVSLSNDDNDMAIIIDSSNVMGATLNADVLDTIDTPFVAGWHQIALTHEDTVASMRVYADGVRVTGTTGSLGLATTNALVVGANTSVNADKFDGLVSHFHLHNRALSASEIHQLYREPFCMFDRDPIELWTGAMGGGVPPVGNAGIMTCNTGFWGA